ncbi:hypothetical protein [Streptomyces sp. VRA16 Mangrove soil]|uniref:hypothetical protein n=1 Tax=Streptomyces sp. VRA16 Mangrove soil TaxID=2817434 RepID=UPI001A9E43C2|nr:hypothetical protein [Streptomyces sp. VRA16 Mangrove soil]MBO1332729.1 hypothetical protein [Streptomyces sp. VRA16 Mangrove soil]
MYRPSRRLIGPLVLAILTCRDGPKDTRADDRLLADAAEAAVAALGAGAPAPEAD